MTSRQQEPLFSRYLRLFLFTPGSARPLACLRIGLAAVLLVRAFALYGALWEVYGSTGFLSRALSDSLRDVLLPAAVPRLGWVVDLLAPLGVSEAACLHGMFWLHVASLLGLLLGWQTRWFAVGAWLTHLMLFGTAVGVSYGVTRFAQIGLFYCVWMPVGHALSLDRLTGWVSGESSVIARLSLRVLQIHLCLAYGYSGLLKASGTQWWNGEAIWRVMMRSDYAQFDGSWLAAVPWVAQLAGWGTLLVEMGYPILVWPARTRKLWAFATIGLHVGIAVTMGLWYFSALMIVLTASAFLVSAEPQRPVPPAGKAVAAPPTQPTSPTPEPKGDRQKP